MENGKHVGPYVLRVSLAIIRPANNGEGSYELPLGRVLQNKEYAALLEEGILRAEYVEPINENGEPAESEKR